MWNLDIGRLVSHLLAFMCQSGANKIVVLGYGSFEIGILAF